MRAKKFDSFKKQIYNEPMSDLYIETIQGEPSEEDRKVMVDGMLAHHASQGHPRVTEQYTVILRNEKKEVLGMAIGAFRWKGMRIETLWVDKSVRNNDWGTKLIQMLEDEARKRNCTVAYTDTYSWQAPAFYEKMGYKLYGKLDYPKGHYLSYYSKNLE